MFMFSAINVVVGNVTFSITTELVVETFNVVVDCWNWAQSLDTISTSASNRKSNP